MPRTVLSYKKPGFEKQAFMLFFIFLNTVLSAQISSFTNSCKSLPELEQQAWLKKTKSLESAAINTYDIIYHRCYWEIDPAVNYIKGNIKTFFKPRTGVFNQLQFDLSTVLAVDSVKYHNSLIAFTQHSIDILQVDLPVTLSANTLDSVTVFYKGSPQGASGFGSFVQGNHNGAPIVWTLSEPYGAKTWWPCKQNLVDKIDSIDILVKVPQGNRVASNGLLLAETSSGTDKIFHWKSRYPVAAYLVAIAVTNYTYYSHVVPLQTGSLQVLNYVYPENLNSAQSETKAIINIIKLFDSLLIEYPFAKEKYGHAQFGASGGMEHQTMSFVGSFGLSLMAHECAHQWFGDHVTCGSWQDIWLNEGFATFFEWLITERYANEGWVSGLPALVKGITSQPGGSVLCSDTTQVGRIFDARLSYSKGAFLLRMLRWTLGDAAYFSALKNYLTDPALKGGYAKTPQLIKHFETASGKDLTRFFDQWYYKEGFPSYKVLWSQTGSVVTVTISQTQSHPSVSFFEMPLPIRFEARGRDSILLFQPSFSGEVLTANLDFSAVDATIDPEFRLISANNEIYNPADLLMSKLNLTLYPNPTGTSISVEGFLKGTKVEQIKITDAAGKTVYQDDERHITTDALVIGSEQLSGGYYSVTIRTDKGSKTLKFLKR